MKVTADTNLLCRLVLDDDLEQKQLVARAFAAAEAIVIVAASLCEVVWVLKSRHGLTSDDIRRLLLKLLLIPRIDVDRMAVDAGLDLLQAGGDFADGLIALDGRRRGGTVFLTFDRRAIQRLRRLGFLARSP